MATARTNSSAKPKIFDGLSFVKYMKNTGRSYKKRAMELVSISRRFAQVQDQTFREDCDLRSVLEVVDEALHSATEAQKKTSKDADEKFNRAIVALSVYEMKYHPGTTEDATMIKKAEEEDKSSSEFLNRLKDNFRVRELPAQGPKKTVDFRLHKSLPDMRPIIVKQVLSKPVNPKEVLWNFNRFRDERRVRLKQNPHFYEVLPTLAENYGGEFRIDPLDLQTDPIDFHHKTDEKIDVLIDKLGPAGRVYLETDKEKRAFGNFWALKKAIIFKDVCGKLEGEKRVGVAFEGVPNLWCFEEPPLSATSRSSNRSNPSSTTTPTTSPTLIDGNWTEQIRRMLLSHDVNTVNIRISAKPPGLGYTGRSSPIPPSYTSSGVGSPSQSQPLTIEIPGESARTSTGPWSPSSYRTARSTPPSPRPPAAELSPRSPEPLSPEPSPILPTDLTVTRVPITAAPAHATPLQSPRVALPLTGPAEPAPTPISSGESISGQAIPPQTFNLEHSPSRPVNISIRKVIDPAMSHALPHAERDEILVARHVPSKPRDPDFVPSPVPVPVIPTPTPVVPTPVPIPLVPTPATPIVPMPIRTPVVPTPVPAKLKRSWYQKCIDVVKNGLGVG